RIDSAIKHRHKKIVFIHGVGQGVLKAELETLFRRYDRITYYDADYKTYGVGATEIYIYDN
ncbi:MAG: Smr/MutS family protein, partial [Psychroflexus sp.]